MNQAIDILVQYITSNFWEKISHTELCYGKFELSFRNSWVKVIDIYKMIVYNPTKL